MLKLDWSDLLGNRLASLAYRWLPRFATRSRLAYNRRRFAGQMRYLEIGPGQEVLSGFERYDIQRTGQSDYVGDARDVSIFGDEEFDLIYASHVLEHIPWYQTAHVLCQWKRILKKGGALEIWVPDGLKIARAYLDASLTGAQDFQMDGWYRFNEQRSADLWFSGRMFSYGDGTGRGDDPNWHRAAFSEYFLAALLQQAGYSSVEKLSSCDVRGYDHGWINLGVRAVK